MLGGTYGELYDRYGGSLKAMGKEIHHIPAWDSTGEPERDGLAILMDRADHRKLNSTGSSDSAGCWRDDIGRMWEAGDQKQAIETEIAEIQTRFEDKYDEALRQMLDRHDERTAGAKTVPS